MPSASGAGYKRHLSSQKFHFPHQSKMNIRKASSSLSTKSVTGLIVLLPQENADLPRTSAPPGAGFLTTPLGAGTGRRFYLGQRMSTFSFGALDVRLRDLGTVAHRLGIGGFADILGKWHSKRPVHLLSLRFSSRFAVAGHIVPPEK
jgi:hypothetical protein